VAQPLKKAALYVFQVHVAVIPRLKITHPNNLLSFHPIPARKQNMWKKIRSGIMFVIACVASPCCTPLIVPLGLALLAGTPFAIWASAHLGWVYGGLTLLSVASLVLGLRWMGQKSASKGSTPNVTIQSIQEINHPQG
jgi:hypothetical protein